MPQFFAAIFMAFALVASAVPASASCDEALQFVDKVGKLVTATVANTSLSSSQRLGEFRTIFKTNADFATMGRIALGRYWNKLPESRRGEYYGLIEQMIVKVMFGQLNDFAGERYSIETQTCNPKGSKGIEFIVEGPVIKDGGGRVTDVRWWVIRSSDGRLRVLDISIGGISLTLQKKDEFDYFITSNERRVDLLLEDLKRKLGS